MHIFMVCEMTAGKSYIWSHQAAQSDFLIEGSTSQKPCLNACHIYIVCLNKAYRMQVRMPKCVGFAISTNNKWPIVL